MTNNESDLQVLDPVPDETEPTPRRRGRPKGSGRKPKTDADGGAAGSSETVSADDAAPAPAKRRGRPPKQRPAHAPEAEAPASTDTDAMTSAATSAAAERADTRASDRANLNDAGERNAGRAATTQNEPAQDETAQNDDARDNAASSAETKAERSADNADRGDTPRRGRNTRNNRRPTLNYRDLQAKILPELHLLAKEVGLSDYRQHSKDELSVAILERAAEAEGLRLVKGYLEISSDGYGFLQESLLQNNTRSVIVSAGLIKQFKLRTGDFILGKARRPRDNERYGTLIRVEAGQRCRPFSGCQTPAFRRPRTDLSGFPNQARDQSERGRRARDRPFGPHRARSAWLDRRAAQSR